MAKLVSTNPGRNYEKIGEVDITDDAGIKEAVKKAHLAKEAWKELGANKRIELLRPVYRECVKRKKEIAALISKEMGTPISECEEGMDFDLEYFYHYLEKGEEYLRDIVTHKEGKAVHKVVFEPYGVVAAIVPWNFPLGMFLWGTVPNLIAGNVVVIKHSEECPLTGKLLDGIFSKALPEGVFTEVYGDGSVGAKLTDEDVDMIWFTGSSAVGKRLYEKAGKKFIKAILEMGGSNPGIVFEDADAAKIAERIYNRRFGNCGQVCDALKRLIVHKSLEKQMVENLKTVIQAKAVGDPSDRKTDLGPLVAERQVKLLEEQVDDALRKGAKIAIGGKRPYLKGAYYLPTILTGVTREMRVWKEEVFGPVLPVITFTTEEEAVELANDTSYGLGANIFTKDLARAKRVASRIKAGSININQGDRWKICTNPFGGYKGSGMGREHGEMGFRELTQMKVIAEG